MPIDKQKLDNQVMLDEGLKLQPYRDTRGFLSTGVGRNLDGNPLTPAEIAVVGHDARTLPITHDQAIFLLHNDETRAMNELFAWVPWWSGLPDVYGRVMVDLMFNMGAHTFDQFHQFAALMRAGAYPSAGDDLENTLWYSQVGKRGPRLVGMLRTGKDYTS